MTSPVTYAAQGPVAVITMDDGKANALSHTMLGALEEALDRAAAENSAVVLAGREGKFCAGFDLKVMMSSPAAAGELVTRGAELCLRLYAFPRPVVAAATGHAMAAGALMLLSSDTRIGTEGDFKLGLNETAIGLTLPAFAIALGRERLDPRRFTEPLIQARIYSPAEAVAVGYLDEAVAPAEVLPRAVAEATRLAALPGHAYAGTKAKLRGAFIASVRGALVEDMGSLTNLPK